MRVTETFVGDLPSPWYLIEFENMKQRYNTIKSLKNKYENWAIPKNAMARKSLYIFDKSIVNKIKLQYNVSISRGSSNREVYLYNNSKVTK